MNKIVTIRAVLGVVVVLLCMFVAFVGNKNTIDTHTDLNELWTMHNETMEAVYREKARDMLTQGKYCINEIIKDKGDSDDSIFYAIDTCMKKARTTHTGDAFAFRTTDYMFIYDPSLDCFVDGGKKFYDEATSEVIMKSLELGDTAHYPECHLHEKPDMCFEARQALTSGYDSKMGNDIGWRFDNAEEWLEWKVLPFEGQGFSGVGRGHESKKPYQIILALGVQSDEILNKKVIDRYFEKTFVELQDRCDFSELLIKILSAVCVLFAFFGIAYDYHIKRIECPYNDEACPNSGREL